MGCYASCAAHIGEIQKVHVQSAIYDWGEFWYCEKAIKEDRRRDLSVEVLLSE